MSTEPATLRARYHHGNLRQALIDTGLQVTRTGGPTALTLRDLARRLGISPNAVYRHFADRDTLLAAVKSRVQHDMAARMADETGHQPDAVSPAVGRLRAVGLGYIDFAVREPGWFEVAFTDTVADPAYSASYFEADARQSEPPPPLAWLLAALDGLVESGQLAPEQRAGAEWPCWSAVHGFALLALQGPLRGRDPADLRAAAERTVDVVIAGLLAPDLSG
jgi:AcrR family transcriptional regulator